MSVRRIKMYENNLSVFSTKELVEELQKRDSVDSVVIEPYESYKIATGKKQTENTGPVIILTVKD